MHASNPAWTDTVLGWKQPAPVARKWSVYVFLARSHVDNDWPPSVAREEEVWKHDVVILQQNLQGCVQTVKKKKKKLCLVNHKGLHRCGQDATGTVENIKHNPGCVVFSVTPTRLMVAAKGLKLLCSICFMLYNSGSNDCVRVKCAAGSDEDEGNFHTFGSLSWFHNPQIYWLLPSKRSKKTSSSSESFWTFFQLQFQACKELIGCVRNSILTCYWVC